MFATFAYNIVLSGYLLGPLACFADTSQVYVWITYRVLAAADLYVGPPLLSAALCVVLMIAMRHRQRARKPLLARHTEEGAAHNGSSKNGSSYSSETHRERGTSSKKNSLQMMHEPDVKKGLTEDVHHRGSTPSGEAIQQDHKSNPDGNLNHMNESDKREPTPPPPLFKKNIQRRETTYRESPLARGSLTSTPKNQSTPTKLPKSESMSVRHGVNDCPASHPHVAASESENCLETIMRKRLNTNDSMSHQLRMKRHHHLRDRAIRGAATAVIIALLHAAFYLPTGFLGLAFYHCISVGAEERLIAVLWAFYFFSMTASAINSLVNLFVYVARIPAFRRRLMGRTPGASTLQHTSELEMLKPLNFSARPGP